MKLHINIPSGYRWLAIQPWGSIMIFKRKPRLIEMPNTTPSGYWDLQKDEITINGGRNKVKDWQNTLKKLA